MDILRSSARAAIVAALAMAPFGGRVAADDPPAAAAGTVEGVVARAGTPIPQARVEIRRLFDLGANMNGYTYRELFERLLAGPHAWPPVATATTDADGRFSATGLWPGIYGAEATVDGASGFASATVPVDGARVAARVDVAIATRSLSGRVVAASGEPFNGALLWCPEAVRAEFLGMTYRGVPVAFDRDGRFSLPAVSASRGALVAVEPGRRLVVSEWFDAGEPPPTPFVLDEGFESLHVRVVDAATGAALPGAVLLAKGPTSGNGFAMVRGTCDSNGACELRAIGAGRGEVWAYVEGYEETGVREVGRGTSGKVTVKMAKAARVVGRVVRDDDGRPVAGMAMTVHAVPAKRRAIDWPHGHAMTDADGRFEIESAQSGDVAVYAESSGWVTKGVTAETLRPENPWQRTLAPGETASIDLRVVPAGAVHGRVLSADGKPVVGAVVRADTYTLDPRGWESFGADAATRAVAATGADGRFTLDGLVVGERVTLHVVAVGELEMALDGVVPALASGPDVEIRLPPTHSFDVTVIDAETSRPVAGARIEVSCFPADRRADLTCECRRWKGESGLDGRVRAGPLPAAQAWVRGSADGYVVGSAMGRSDPPFDMSFTIRMFRPTTLAGHVVWPDGTPAAGQEVKFRTEASQPCDAEGQTKTDADGTFTFDAAAPCELEVSSETFDRGGAKAAVKAVGGAKDVVLRMVAASPNEWNADAPPFAVRVEGDDGRPVAFAWATVRAAHDVVLRAPVEDGAAVFRGLAPGSPLLVTVTDARDARGRRLPFASASVAVAAGETGTVLRLPAGQSIEGRVVAADDKPVGSVRLAAVKPDALGALLLNPALDTMATSAADGTFRIAGLDDGPHVLVVDGGAAGIAVESPRVDAGAKDVVVHLRPAASARVTVVGPTGEKVADASVRYRFTKPHVPSVIGARTDAEGVAVLAGLDPDAPGTLTVESTTGIAPPKTDWRPKDETVRVGATPAESKTDVVVHPDAAIEKGHNVLWCATSQLAWDAMTDAIAKAFPPIAADGKLPLLAPAPPDLVERLNRRFFPHDAIDPKASVVVGGLARDGVVERIAQAWRATFGPDATPPVVALEEKDAAGVAGIAKELPFAQPFSVHGDPMAFDGGPTILRSWGIRSYEHGPGANLAAAQVVAYVPEGERPFERRAATAVVELSPTDPDEKIVLAKVEPKATLEATWAAVEEILRTWRRDSVDPGSFFQVPTIRLDASEQFKAFEGAPIKDFAGSFVRRFTERVKFRLSERGASIAAESAIVCSLGIHPKLVFDGPFLVALRRKDAKVPYLLLWVGNDALLERAVSPIGDPLDAATLEPLIGRWTLDRERSNDATILRQYTLMEGGLEALGFPPGAKPAPEEILRRAKAKQAGEKQEEHWDVRLTVFQNGHAAYEWAFDRPSHPDQRPENRHEGVLERFDGKVVLRFVVDPRTGPDGPGPAREARMPIVLRDGRIEIAEDQMAWVLQRK